jgi:hypothetical protein
MRGPRRTLVLSAAFIAVAGCNADPQPGGKAAPRRGASAAPVRVPAAAPAPYVYPAPVKGHYKEVNTGDFDLVDGIAYTASGGTVVFVTEKAIASPVLAGSTCPMTQARALALLRKSAYLEVTVDAAGRSNYFAAGVPYGGQSREEDVGGRYWKITGGKPAEGRVSGSVAYRGHGGFEFDLPVSKPGVNEVSMGDRVHGTRSDETRRAPTRDEVVAAYTAIRRAALAKDLEAMLRVQGFDAKQVEAIRGLPGIEADLPDHADRFMVPGDPEEADVRPGYGQVGGRGKNSKEKAFFNFYEFAPCGEKLVLVGIGENPQ